MIAPLSLTAGAVLVYAVLSRRLARTVVTAPIFFTSIGLLAGPVLGIVDLRPTDAGLVLVLESALVMVLFADASSLDIRRWTKEPSISGRLLGIGLPLTMLLGAVVAMLVLPGLQPWQAGLIGVILAPTDAALGQAVVANPQVPAVVRNALNVESGLNDGLALPFVTILIAIGLLASGMESELRAVQTLALALGGSTVIGLVVGLVGGRLISVSADRRAGGRWWLAIGLVALAAGAYSLADSVGASGFLSVWVAGLCAGWTTRGHLPDPSFELPEQAADALAAIGFLLLGVGLIAPIVARATPATVLYAALSLTVVRMAPVAVSMLRTGFARPTVAYVGWFGPRGLASIVFAGLVAAAGLPASSAVTDVVLLTVAISLVVHGVSAAWGARRYAAWYAQAATTDPAIPEAAALAAPHVRRSAVRPTTSLTALEP